MCSAPSSPGNALGSAPPSRSSPFKLDFLPLPLTTEKYAPVFDELARASGDPLALWRLQAMEVWPQERTMRRRLYLLRENTRPVAALFLYEKFLCGIPIGSITGDDSQGELLFLCAKDLAQELFSTAIHLLFRKHRIFRASITRPADAAPLAQHPQGTLTDHLQESCRWQLPLLPTLDETLAPLGRRARRNFRYTLRRSQQNGWRFYPELTLDQYADATRFLASRTAHPYSAAVAENRVVIATQTPGFFAQGLADAQGGWLSVLCGRRRNGVTDLFWQPNRIGHRGDSLATTLRALFVREELHHDTRLVRFIAGTTYMLEHYCVRSGTQRTYIVRPGLRSKLFGWTRTDTAPPPPQTASRPDTATP